MAGNVGLWGAEVSEETEGLDTGAEAVAGDAAGVDLAAMTLAMAGASRDWAESARYPKPTYAWYVLGVLTLVLVFSFLDRQILNLLVGPVRHSLQISDTQMSLLIGIAFAAFYVSFGIPLGRIADSRSRRGLITAGFALWSLFSAGCGLAGNYSQLLIMRMGVGVGEATLNPAAYSLITDYFPPHLRGIAQGIYSAGIYIGAGIALVLGGLVTGWASRQPELAVPLIGSVRSWQVVFLVIGLAGLLCVPLMLSVKEPTRRGTEAGRRSIPLSEVIGHFKKNWKTYGCHNVGIALLGFSAYAATAWIPTFLIRHHHWTIAQTGLVFGIMAACVGPLGMICTGWLADRIAARGHRDACLLVAFSVAVLWLPTEVGFLLVPSATLAAILLAPTIFLSAGAFSVGPAALMQVTPQRMRGQAGAIFQFAINLIGLGLGPTAVALCTDYLFHDDNKVGYSILIVTAAALSVAASFLWLGRKHFIQSLEREILSLAAQSA
jgi:MFS family permease